MAKKGKKDAGDVTAEEARKAVEGRQDMPPPVGAVVLPPTLGEGMKESLNRMRRRAAKEEVPLPLPWPGLAAQLGGGLWPQMFTLLVGTTGSGKSQLAVQVALHAVRKGTPVLYVALELDTLGMHARTLALRLRDDEGARAPKWSELYLGEDAEGVARAASVADDVGALPFHLEVGGVEGWDYRRLHKLAELMRDTYRRPFLVVLDFMQLVEGYADDDRDMRLRMKGAAYAGREVARKVDGATVLYLSATSRENYGALEGETPLTKSGQPVKGHTPLGQGNPARLVGAAKESGDVEYGADTLLVLAREQWEDTPPPDGTHMWVAVAKVRAKARSAGVRPGWVPLRFDGSCFGEPRQEGGTSDEWVKP